MTQIIQARTGTVLSGVDTLVRLFVLRHQLDARAGLATATMLAGYPGSPLGTLDLAIEQLGDALTAHRIVHRPGLNEELAVATVWGSQMGAVVDYADVDGVVGGWYGKGPGLDRAGDALRHANAMGAGPHGGAVLFCGDDPSAKSSTLACDSQFTFEDACVPVLYPADQQDALDLGIHAFQLSRYAGCWVGMKIVTAVADGTGAVDLSLDRHAPSDPSGLVIEGTSWRHRPQSTIGPHAVPDQEALIVDRRLRAAQAYVRHNGLDRVVGADPGARLGVVCAGKTYYDVLQAFAELGVSADGLASIGVRILKLAMTYPLVEETVREFADSVEELVVVEEKRPFVETHLRGILHEAGSRTPVSGKRDRAGRVLASSVGELDPSAVANILTRLMPALAPAAADRPRVMLPLLQLPSRSPGYCSGCPHNRSTVFPEDALVGGGVGCHGIMYFEARNVGMKSLPPTPMGAEGVPWIGLAPFVAEPHVIQNIGDGTLSHSGTLAIRASVAAGVNITYKILYNSAVAMTGGQDVTGLLDVPAMTRALEAEGVAKIVVCAEDPKRYGRRASWAPGATVLGRDRLPDVQESLRQVPGVTVIIYDQRCAAEARRLRGKGLLPTPPRRVLINEAVCEGCGDCGTKSNCLSVLPHETEFGEKRRIHDSSCNRDYTCLEGDCPSFITITPKRRGRRAPVAARPSLPAGSLPVPPRPTVAGRFGVYFTGIGGTGVVTAGRITARAAEAAGLVTGGLDQTGLSQKAGAVVSQLLIAESKNDLGSSTVTPGGADLYLSSDVLQAGAANHLAKIGHGRTLAVIDPHLTPTAAMLQSDVPAPDPATLEATILDRTGEGRTAFIDSVLIAEGVFADHRLANVVLLGAAFQLGGLPFSLADVVTAIGRRGKSAAANLEAFEWGRWAVYERSAVDAALAGVSGAVDIADPSPAALVAAVASVAGRTLPAPLAGLLTRRAAQVVDYQNVRLAGRYLDLVERVAGRDAADHDWALTRAVTESWFKVLTYKDEYEVARLLLETDTDRAARELGIDGPYAVTYQLHPPLLRSLGLKKKLPMGRPYELSFRVLRRLKRLRGTPLDVFGWHSDRRTERAVIGEYEQLMGETVDLPYETQVELAGSPLAIKGYAEIKERAVAAWRARVAELRQP